mgnify:CR=1 FL=1
MAKLLDLRGQRAAAGPAAAETDLAHGLAGRDAGQSAPIDSRIVFW